MQQVAETWLEGLLRINYTVCETVEVEEELFSS